VIVAVAAGGGLQRDGVGPVPWFGEGKAPILSIRAVAGSQRSRCSSDPSSAIDCIARKLCTP